MRKLNLLITIIFCIVNTYVVYAEEYVDPSFFPIKRPKNAKLYHIEGIIEEYSCCYKGVYFALKLSNRKEIYPSLSYSTKFNGKEISCGIDDKVTKKEVTCKDWPKEIILGKTKVVMTYWYQKHYGTKYIFEGENINATPVPDYSIYTMEMCSDQVDVAK